MKLIFCMVLGVLGMLSSTCFAQVEEGKASYYADKFKGRRTSSGEPYHPDSLTCAHRTHPFGTLLLVSCAARGTSVIVRVNDRGPFGKGRVVDLSKAAAQQLGIILAGVADVAVQVVEPEPLAPIFPTIQALEPLASRHVTYHPVIQPSPYLAIPQPPRVPVYDESAKSKRYAQGKKATKSKSRR